MNLVDLMSLPRHRRRGFRLRTALYAVSLVGLASCQSAQQAQTTGVDFSGSREEANAQVIVDGRFIGRLPAHAPAWADTGEFAGRDAIVLTLQARLALGKHDIVVVTSHGDTLRGQFDGHESGSVVISNAPPHILEN